MSISNAHTLGQFTSTTLTGSVAKYFHPKRFGDFEAQACGEYLVQGVLPLGLITLLAAQAKAGKTELTSHLLNAIACGQPFCGLAVKQGKVLYISEEPEGMWYLRIKRLGLSPDHVGQCLPFSGKPTIMEWKTYIQEVANYVCSENINLVVIDTLGNLGPSDDENSNSEIPQFMTPLRALCQAGTAVLVIHHYGWNAQRPRGASALVGFADVVVNFSRVSDSDESNRQRRLKIQGRLFDLRSEMVIELSEDKSGYALITDMWPA